MPKVNKFCWYCDFHNEQISDDFFGDFNCKKCGVMNSIYDPTKAVDYVPTGTERNEEMPNIGDLNKFLTAMDVADGDVITFKDAGIIEDRDFSEEKDGSDIRPVLDISVMLSDGRVKSFSPNKTSRNNLGEVYGSNTDSWIGKKAIVEIIKQNVRGTIRKVIYLKPHA